MGYIKNITLENPNFKRTMPMWMREDDCDSSLAESMDRLTIDAAKKLRSMSKWTRIDEMSESELDELAWELNVSWYLYDRDIKMKREIIKNAPYIHKKIGTKWALEQVLTIYFNESKVLEWFDYGGRPGHFKIEVVNTETVDKDAEAFLKVLNDVKKASQILDTIDVITENSTLDLQYVTASKSADIVQSIIRVQHVTTLDGEVDLRYIATAARSDIDKTIIQ